MVKVMRYGQHAITAVLVFIGVVRAINDHSNVVITLAGSTAFAIWYVAGAILTVRLVGRKFDALWLVGLTAIWVGLTAVSSEFIWVAFPLWLLAGQFFTLPTSILFSLFVMAVVIGAPVLRTGSVNYAFIIGPVVGGVFAFGISRGYLQLVNDARERQHLVASLVQAQDDMAKLHDELGRSQRESGMIEERTRISRDIHDTIAQGLSAIVLLTRAHHTSSPEEATAALARVEAIAVDNLVDVRRIVDALSPRELEEGALASALRRMLDRLTLESGIYTELSADTPLPMLSVAADVALLRTAQSALSNVRIHSGATRVIVNLVDAEDSIRLDIVDDGHGFDFASWSHNSDTNVREGYGLRSMRARLRELGGGLDIETAENDGTALSAYVPLGPNYKVSENR